MSMGRSSMGKQIAVTRSSRNGGTKKMAFGGSTGPDSSAAATPVKRRPYAGGPPQYDPTVQVGSQSGPKAKGSSSVSSGDLKDAMRGAFKGAFSMKNPDRGSGVAGSFFNSMLEGLAEKKAARAASGSEKKMKSGGIVRGCGCATRGTRKAKVV